jgi:hypothetical protein
MVVAAFEEFPVFIVPHQTGFISYVKKQVEIEWLLVRFELKKGPAKPGLLR